MKWLANGSNRVAGLGALLPLVTLVPTILYDANGWAWLFAFWIGVAIEIVVCYAITLTTDRFLGPRVTAAIMIGLMGALTAWQVAWYQPERLFRRFVWAGAPRSIQVETGTPFSSFSDGTTYAFVVSASQPDIRRMVRELSLEEDDQHRKAVELGAENLSVNQIARLAEPWFGKRQIPGESTIYVNNNLSAIWVRDTNQVFVVRRPHRQVRP